MKIEVRHINPGGHEFQKEYTVESRRSYPSPEQVQEAVDLVPDHHVVSGVRIDPEAS